MRHSFLRRRLNAMSLYGLRMKMKKIIIVLLSTVINAGYFAQPYSNLFDHTNSPIDETNLHSLAIDSSQVVWLGSYPNVYRFLNGGWQYIDPNIFSDTMGTKYYIQDIQVSGSGEVWLTKAHYGRNNGMSLYKYSDGIWATYNASTVVLEPIKIFIDNNNKPWFILYNWWPNQQGFDKIGTLDDDTLKIIDLPWHAAQFDDIIKIEDTLFVTVYSDTMGVLEIFNNRWEIIETKDWRPKHIWKDIDHCILGSEKISEFNGTKFYYYDMVNSFLKEHNTNASSFVREN